MKNLLILARGDGRAFFDLAGKSILADLPFQATVFVDKRNAKYFSGLPSVSHIEIVRWSDLKTVATQAAVLHEKQAFFAIATLDEKMIDFTAALRERLNVQGFKSNEVSRFRNKVEMKQRLVTSTLHIPKFAVCSDRIAVQQLLAETKKIVIKPYDGLGSRDVQIISDITALNTWFDNEPTPDSYEAEEFIDGTLYHINAIVIEGEIKLTASAPYLPGMANIDFAAGTPFVTVMLTEGELKNRLEIFSNEVIATLQLHNGVTHLECFVTPENEIIFCEIAVRPGGGGIVWMIEAQYGVNFSRAAILIEAGESKHVFNAQHIQQDVSGLIGFRAGNGGIVRNVANVDVFHDQWIHSAYIDVEKGAFVAPSAHCTDYMALVIFSSKDHAEFNEKRNQLERRFYDQLAFDPI